MTRRRQYSGCSATTEMASGRKSPEDPVAERLHIDVLVVPVVGVADRIDVFAFPRDSRQLQGNVRQGLCALCGRRLCRFALRALGYQQHERLVSDQADRNRKAAALA